MNNKTVHATKWKQKRNNKIVHAEKMCFSQIPPCDQMLVGLTVNNVVCNTTLKEVNKSFNCPYLIGIFNFFLYSNKIRPIITAQNHNFSSPSYNCCRACINESVSMLHVRSMFTSLQPIHVKSAPYFLRSFLPSLIKKVLDTSTPQLLYSDLFNVQSLGKGGIYCSLSFLCTKQILTHFPIRLFTMVLHRTTQNGNVAIFANQYWMNITKMQA